MNFLYRSRWKGDVHSKRPLLIKHRQKHSNKTGPNNMVI